MDLEKFKPQPKARLLAAELNISSSETVIGCVSSLHRRKGIEEILLAFKILLDWLPDSKLTCLLVGRNWQRWAELAKDLKIDDRVVFTGFKQDVPEVLTLFDIFVLPSRDEGLGTSILEAMAAGLPVVASNVGGIPEALTENTGITVPARSPAELAEAIKNLVEDRHKRIAMGEAASNRVREEFSLTRFVDRAVGLYKHLMENTPQRGN